MEEFNVTTEVPSNSSAVQQVLAETPVPDAGPLGAFLWLPYVLLTLVLIAMLAASFVNFHFKYQERYVKRTATARGKGSGANGPRSQNGGLASVVGEPPPKTRRLKMFYGNKVDVSSIVMNSMLDNALQAGGRKGR